MSERGSVTVSALVLTTLAALVMVVMIRAEHGAITRSGLYAEAAQAGAVLDGAELSVVTALVQDLENNPDIDHHGEAWSAVEEEGAPIANGRFWLDIKDAQGRYNINTLTRGALSGRQVFRRLASRAGIEAEAIEAIEIFMAALGPVDRLEALGAAGVSARDIARLAPYVTALPGETRISLNAAPEPVLAALFSDPVTARTLAARRAAGRPITPQTLRSLRLARPPLAGFTSSWFEVESRVQLGRIDRRRVSLVHRRAGRDGAIARIVARRPAASDQGA